MPFTNAELLTSQMHSSQVSALLAGLTIDPFGEADTIITHYTGIEPPADADDADKLLTTIATRIVIWHLSGRQQGLPRDEWERRKAMYDEAMKWLEQIADGLIVIEQPAVVTGPQFRAEPLRGGNW
jgi:hypothetical protein